MQKPEKKIIPIPVEPVIHLYDNGHFEAAKELGKVALLTNPTNIALVNTIAGSHYHLKEYKEADFYMERLVKTLKVDVPGLKTNYALTLYYLRKIPEALAYIKEQWTSVNDPIEDTEMGLNLSVFLGHSGRYDEAFEILKQLDQTNNYVLFNSGWHYLRNGEFLKGFQYIVNGNKEKLWGSEQQYNLPRYKRLKTSTDIRGKTILMANEGGQGDEILFARFAQVLKQRGAMVNMGCTPHLVSVFKRLPDINVVLPINEAIETNYDFYLPSMNSVAILKLDSPVVPVMRYIKAVPEKVQEKKKIIDGCTLGGKPTIGIRWEGNQKFEHEQFRTLPVRDLLRFFELGSLFSIQKDSGLEKLRPGDPIVDLRDDMETWEDTLGYLENFDYIVTSCTSITHAAAAMGKKVCVIVPIVPYFPWAELKQTSQWYPNIRVFVQKRYDSWEEPIQACYDWIKQDIEHA